MAALEFGRVKKLYSDMPDFVAYGRYRFRFMFASNSGNFKMFKLSDSVFVKLQDGRTFILPWDSLMGLNLKARRVVHVGDTTVLRDSLLEVKIFQDKLLYLKARGVEMRLSEYSYEPFYHPRKMLVRFRGATVDLRIDSVFPLD